MNLALSLLKHKIAREIDQKEGLDLLQEARDKNLVQFGENVKRSVSFLCNCCGCCCEALSAARKFGFMHPVHTTNYVPDLKEENCTGCGRCVSVCPVEALSLVSANDPQKKKKKKAKFYDDTCLGCGVCVKNCPHKGMTLKERDSRVLVPLNSLHRTVVMAIERNQLQNLIFDNQAHLNHRLMAAILGSVLKLPPVKRALASQQVNSRYIEHLCGRK